MGVFYNPPTDVVEGRVGREVPVVRKHEQAMAALLDGEHLYIGLSRVAFWAVGCIDDPYEFEAANEAIDRAPEVKMFALPEEAHQHALGLD